MSDWHRLGITELQSAFARDQITPSALLEYYLARVDAHNPVLRAYIEVDRDGARASAAESDRRFQRDTQRPLEGIVIGIKANIAVKGLELSAGMRARQGIVANGDAEIVQKLRDAGAVIIGTLNMNEAALGATTDNRWFGRCINPHGDARTPGGSSGGSGVAVAAGLCVAALGTDTLGSIRIPAAYCGVFGLKPTNSATASRGLVPMSERFDAVGPLARSMDDLSILSNVLFTPDLSTAMRRSKMFTLADLGDVGCEPDVLAAYKAVLAELPEPPAIITLPKPCGVVRTAAFVMATRDLAVSLVALGKERCSQFSDELEKLIDFAISRSEPDLVADAQSVSEIAAILQTEIGANGILITPTTPQVGFVQGERAPTNQADFTGLANIAGLPAISIPVARDQAGMPIGIQLIGPAGGEAMLIAQARMLNDRLRGYAPPPKFW